MTRILIVDDYSLVRTGIATMLHAIDPTVLTREAARCDEAIAAAALARSENQPFDWVLLDLNLPDLRGFDALVRFRETFPDLPVVVVSGQEDPASVERALSLGARSFLPKTAVPHDTHNALAALLRGEVFLPPALTEGLDMSGNAALVGSTGALTERQVEVLGLVVQGLSNKLIARKLGIAESTVKIHVSAVLREFRVTTRTQALLEVARRRLRFPPR